MNPPPPPNLSQAIATSLELLGLVACVAVWKTIVMRWLRRQPVLPYQPRRPVPWRTIDAVLIASFYVFSQAVVFQIACRSLDVPPKALISAQKATLANHDDPMSRAHPLGQVLSESRDPWVILLCVVSAAVVAPITEELVFRLVLQGWLESMERRMRRRIPFLRRLLAGFMPVTTVAILFAALHGRSAEMHLAFPVLVFLLAVHCMSNLLTIVLSLCWLKFASGGTLTDFGIVPSKLASDLRTAGLAFLAVTIPLLIVNVDLNVLLPKNIVADPIPIFFLAIVFGILYYRTHRIVPSLALHMAFNTVGVLIALTQAK
jgi:membrane protease YdiL (CAAX protease family)